MPTSLGTGHNVAEVYERGGERPLFKVPAVSSLEWNRNLDAVSRATVAANPSHVSDMPWAECCGLLSTIHPWAHEVVMFRDDERVWEGPVRRVVQSRAGVTIYASDVLGWTEKRTTSGRVVTDSPVRTEAVAAITTAFTADDPNVLAHLTTLGATTRLTSLDIRAGAGPHSATLATLLNAGLYYTVVGRRIVLWADETVIGTTPILHPTRHLVGDVEVAREGDSLATQVTMVNDDHELGAAGGTDPFYGLVEQSPSAAGIVGGIGTSPLDTAAAAYLARHYPAPNTLTIPAGATLHCDAPFPIGALVPGVHTPVKVTDMCWPVDQTMILTAVKVTEDDKGEKVGVTYAPLAAPEGETA